MPDTDLSRTYTGGRDRERVKHTLHVHARERDSLLEDPAPRELDPKVQVIVVDAHMVAAVQVVASAHLEDLVLVDAAAGAWALRKVLQTRLKDPVCGTVSIAEP